MASHEVVAAVVFLWTSYQNNIFLPKYLEIWKKYITFAP